MAKLIRRGRESRGRVRVRGNPNVLWREATFG
jgi:hypothetical protein